MNNIALVARSPFKTSTTTYIPFLNLDLEKKKKKTSCGICDHS